MVVAVKNLHHQLYFISSEHQSPIKIIKSKVQIDFREMKYQTLQKK